MLEANENVGPPSAARGFATTRWSLIAAARDGAPPQARAALAALCSTYWYPLYTFIRRQGHNADEAQDLTQEFFARLLEKDFLEGVDQAKGKFRAFLLASCSSAAGLSSYEYSISTHARHRSTSGHNLCGL